MLGELLESPGEQQTEITWRHFVKLPPKPKKMNFYRIDLKLNEDIPRDAVGSIDQLREYGKRLAKLINWEAILAGTDETFRVNYEKKLLPQYAKTV